MAAKNDKYTYRVTWSENDNEYVGLCAECPGLSWLADTVRIVGFCMHDKQDQAEQMIQAGASAYCTKDGSTDELLSAIRRSD